jgi:cell division septation protein DedD
VARDYVKKKRVTSSQYHVSLKASHSPIPKKWISFRLIVILIVAFVLVGVVFYFHSKSSFSPHAKVVIPAPDGEVLTVQPAVKAVMRLPVKFNFQAQTDSSPKTVNGYLLQLASVADEQKAKILQKTVHDLGYHANIQMIEIADAGTGKVKVWYRVQLGPYKDRTMTIKVQQVLEAGDIPSIIVS